MTGQGSITRVFFSFQRKKESRAGLLTAFFVSVFFHLLFVFFFRITSSVSGERIFTLPFTTVDVDLGEMKKNKDGSEVALIFPIDSSSSLSMQELFQFVIIEPQNLCDSFIDIEPDFSSIEQIPYTSPPQVSEILHD